MPGIQHVEVGAFDPHRFGSVLEPPAYQELLELIDSGARELMGRVVWNVNSTAYGGGVAELLRPLLGYSRGAGVDARWVVISGPPEFFQFTKRLHARLHGFDREPRGGSESERAIYEQTMAQNAAELVELVGPRDIVILHDPQTAGLVPAVVRTGASVIWRCHVGLDRANASAREAWAFLRSYVASADAYVFSRSAFVWEGLAPERVALIQPSIDAFLPKNQDQVPQQSEAILARAGLTGSRSHSSPTFTRSDGSPGRVDRRAEMLEVAPAGYGDPLVTQISRWDRLKDPIGVLRGFAESVVARSQAHLVLAGPSPESVADDPEAAQVFAAVREAWHGLPEAARQRVHLAALPMADVEENAAIVNALQRHASVVVQKSLAEGFGLTVAEAMWKEAPVVASRVGGIQDQIVDGESGVLVSDPHDLAGFGTAILKLLDDRQLAARMGREARLRVTEHFLGPHQLQRYFDLIRQLVAEREADR